LKLTKIRGHVQDWIENVSNNGMCNLAPTIVKRNNVYFTFVYRICTLFDIFFLLSITSRTKQK